MEVLGRTGKNFAAGMSGGIAYVLDNFGDYLPKKTLMNFMSVEKSNTASIKTILKNKGIYERGFVYEDEA